MESKQNRTLKEFDSLYKMIDDVYHEIALSMHLTDSAFLILYCLLELGDGCSQKDICKLYSISKQTFFTEFGREFSEKHICPVFDMENATFESMEPSECEQLLSLTRKYVQILKKNMKQYVLEEKEF